MFVSTLLPAKLIAQQEIFKINSWEYKIGTCSIFPQDKTLKKFFGPYYGVFGGVQKKVKKNLYLEFNGNIGFKGVKGSIIEFYINQEDFSALLLYKRNIFSIGVGPKVALRNINGRKLMMHDGRGYLKKFKMEKHSGFGLSFEINYNLLIFEKLDLFICGNYSKFGRTPGKFDLSSNFVGMGVNF